MTKKDNYTCPRCGYETRQKIHMRAHLFNLKKLCPGSKALIDLTEEIKQFKMNIMKDIKK